MLIESAISGDMKAMEELIRRVQKDIFTMFSYLTNRRQDASDLTQEALLKMARGLSGLKDTKNFRSWLNHIVTNIFYDYLRKHSKDKNIDFDNDKILEIKDKIGCEPGERCRFSEMEKLIKSALFSLPETLRLTIILREFEGLSYDDIAKVTDTAVGTVKSRIARARLKLQEELKDFI